MSTGAPTPGKFAPGLSQGAKALHESLDKADAKQIAGYLHDDKQALVNLARTHSSLRDIAQSALFRTIKLSRSLANTKQTAKCLTLHDCRLLKLVKKLELTVLAMLTEEQVNEGQGKIWGGEPGTWDLREVEFQGREFTMYLVHLFAAFTDLGLKLNLMLNAFEELGIWQGMSPFLDVVPIFIKSAALPFGYVDMGGCLVRLDVVFELSDDFKWLSGKPKDMGLQFDSGQAAPGFDTNVFQNNMRDIRTMTINKERGTKKERGDSNERQGLLQLDNREFESICHYIVTYTGATTLNMKMSLFYPGSIQRLGTSRFTSLVLEDLVIESLHASSAFKACTGLRQLCLSRICLFWDEDEKTSDEEPWEAIFVALARLPLQKLGLHELYYVTTELYRCHKKNPRTFITTREEDAYALKALVGRVLETDGTVFSGREGRQPMTITRPDELGICMHGPDISVMGPECPHWRRLYGR